MSTVLDIESAIRQLPEGDFWELAEWFDEARAEAWDRQIQLDAQAGRLNFLFEEATKARQQRETKTWPRTS